MAYKDKTLRCVECGQEFTFNASEQEFHASRGYTNEPKRCPTCRAARRGSLGSGSEGRRELYPATCARCGVSTQVPFQPRGDRPVYCSDCYQKQRLTGPSRR